MLPDRRVHTTLPVSDLDRTRRFYENTLGFKPIEGNPAAILYRAGEGTVFAITRSSGKAAGTHTQMGFTVQDIAGGGGRPQGSRGRIRGVRHSGPQDGGQRGRDGRGARRLVQGSRRQPPRSDPVRLSPSAVMVARVRPS